MFDLLKPLRTNAGIASAINSVSPAVMRDKTPLEPEEKAADLMAEYAAIAKAAGFSHPSLGADLAIEQFKDFLRAKDWGVFSLATVIPYMDELAKKSGAGYGWEWRPLRKKDQIAKVLFGTPSHYYNNNNMNGDASAAKDYYYGEHSQQRWNGQNNEPQTVPASSQPYDRVIPLHALKKVVAIEAEFKAAPVSFFVSDYAPAPHIVTNVDPFLLAVINNPKLDKGIGRFVIDFWDEPGFGLDQQLA